MTGRLGQISRRLGAACGPWSVALAILLAACAALPAGVVAPVPPQPAPQDAAVAVDSALSLPPTLASRALVDRILAELPPAGGRKRLGQILRWVEKHVPYDEGVPWDRWRTVDEIVRDGRQGGCAEQSLVVGALARGSGIPVLWVKSLDSDWIWDVQRGRRPPDFRGHVYLQVLLEGRWCLLDATEAQIYEDYDQRSDALPSGRVAYGRGTDPYELILSPRAKEWIAEAERVSLAFDTSRLPPGRPAPVDRSSVAYVVGDYPYYEWATAAAAAHGYQVAYSFNTGFEEWLPRTRGSLLLVVAVGSEIPIPTPWAEELIPVTSRELGEALGRDGLAVFRRDLPDGTRVVFVGAKDDATLRAVLGGLDLPDPSKR